MTSLTDNDTSRIMCLDIIHLDDDILMVTGGRDLKLWRQTRDGSTGIRSRVLRLAPCHDSGSDTETSDDEVFTGTNNTTISRVPEKNTGFCNCVIA